MKNIKKLLLYFFMTITMPLFALNNINKTDTPPEHTSKIYLTDANIVGHVINAETKEYMPYVKLSIKGTTINVETDKTGHYMFKNLPIGKKTLIIFYPGYKTIHKDIVTKKDTTLNLKFSLTRNLIDLNEVVVSANRNETQQRLAPALVSILNANTFEETNSPTLAGGLKFQPGIRVEDNCESCGFSQIRINGLQGSYTQILLDSRAIFSNLIGVYGLEMIPSNMIERIEVMRGGSSALFGSSAIAGTINIITKEPHHNSGMFSHIITNINGSNSFDNTTSLNTSLVTDDHKAGILLFGRNRQRDGYDHDGDHYTDIPKISSQVIGFHSYLKINDYSKLTLEYHHLEEKRRGGNKLNMPAYMADLCTQIYHSIDGGETTFDWFSKDEKHHFSAYSSVQNTNRDSYYMGYGRTHGLNLLAGGQYCYNFNYLIFMPSTITAGLEHNYESLKDKSYEYEHKIDQKTKVNSFFLQNEWKSNQWSLLLGGRLDKHNLINHAIFSPRINIRFNPTQNINIRLGYTEGYRAPQIFDEDLHKANVNQQVTIVEPNANLKEERSKSLSFSADIYKRLNDNWQVNYTTDIFYTHLKNVFKLIKQDDPSTPDILEEIRINEDGAKVWGINIEGNLAYKHLFKIQTGATLQRSQYDNATSWNNDDALALKSMLRSPDYYGYFTSSFYATKALTLFFNGKYTGHMITAHNSVNTSTIDRNTYTPSFFEFGTNISYNIPLTQCVNLQINVGINNIFNDYQDDFDKGKTRDSGYIYGPSLPRTFFAGIKAMF